MMPDKLNGATPGRDRVVLFQIQGQDFCFRRPSRGDIAAIHRRYVLKLALTGVPTDSELLNVYDGASLLWEARLEVGLLPRSKERSLGERAPSHWVDGEAISFTDVDRDEFEQVCDFLAENVFLQPPDEELAAIDRRIAQLTARREVVLERKKLLTPTSPPGNSGGSANASTSA